MGCSSIAWVWCKRQVRPSVRYGFEDIGAYIDDGWVLLGGRRCLAR